MTADIRPPSGTALRDQHAQAPDRRGAARRACCACLVAGVAALLVGWPGLLAASQGIEVQSLEFRRRESGYFVDFHLVVTLPPGVGDALQRGVPLYFTAEAAMYKPRWYWRDDRVGSVSRTWRLSFQPLTGSYRLSLGALSQTFPTFDEAMTAMIRMSQWRVADAAAAEPEDRPYVEFSWRLDVSQLPRPMQISIGDRADWALEVQRIVRLAP